MFNLCIDCEKLLTRKDAKRCQKCNSKYCVNKNNSNWKGGKPKCIDCKKQLGNYGRKRCYKCNKKYQFGINASNYKGVLYKCIDCKKKLANMYATRCQSCAKKGKRNSHFGITPMHTKRIYYNKTIFRSLWEANFAKWCDLSSVKWKYESKTFDLGDTTYTPDFYLLEFDCYIEIKGYWYKLSKEKFNKFTLIFNKINIKVYNKQILEYMNII